MKRLRHLIALALFLLPIGLRADEQPPFEVKDPAITENFRAIYYSLDKLSLNFATLNFLFGDGSQTIPSLGFINEPTTGIFRLTFGFGAFSALGIPVFAWSNQGVFPVSNDMFNLGSVGNRWAQVHGQLVTGSTLTASSVFYGPNGTAAAPTFSFSNHKTEGMWVDDTNSVFISANGSTAASIVVSTGGCSVNSNALFPLGVNGSINNDFIVQVSNASSGSSAVSVVSASTGRSTVLLAAFGSNYSDTRAGLPAADLSAIEFAGDNISGGLIVTQKNVPLYFGTNQNLGVTIATGTQNATFVGGIAASSGVFVNSVIATTGTFSGQLIGKGTVTNDSAAVGYIGQSTETVASAANAAASGAQGDLASVTLGSGDWDVSCMVQWFDNGATWTRADFGLSTTSGNSGTGLTIGDTLNANIFATFAGRFTQSIPPKKFSLASTTTVYLKYRSDYSGGPPQAQGRLTARRMR